jgi:hypothetical protein
MIKWDENTEYIAKISISKIELLREVASITSKMYGKKTIYIQYVRSILEKSWIIVGGKNLWKWWGWFDERWPWISRRQKKKSLHKLADTCMQNEETKIMFLIRKKRKKATTPGTDLLSTVLLTSKVIFLRWPLW